MVRLTEVDKRVFMENPLVPQEIKDYVKEGRLSVQYCSLTNGFLTVDKDGDVWNFYPANW